MAVLSQGNEFECPLDVGTLPSCSEEGHICCALARFQWLTGGCEEYVREVMHRKSIGRQGFIEAGSFPLPDRVPQDNHELRDIVTSSLRPAILGPTPRVS